MRKPVIAHAKIKTQISCAVTAQLTSAFAFATWIVQSRYFLNPKFQASSHLLWLYSPVCVGPGRKSRRPVFSQRGSGDAVHAHILLVVVLDFNICQLYQNKEKLLKRHSLECIIRCTSWETCLLGFRSGPLQPQNITRSRNFGFMKKRDCTIYNVCSENKSADQLACFMLSYMQKSRFSHGAALTLLIKFNGNVKEIGFKF